MSTKIRFSWMLALCVFLAQIPMAQAADSYRWLTVTIQTPWMIFLFLLPLVLVPLILMAILQWRYAIRSADVDDDGNRRGRPKDDSVIDGRK